MANWRPTEEARLKMQIRGIPGQLVEEVLDNGKDAGSGTVRGSKVRDLTLEDGCVVRVVFFPDPDEDIVFSVHWIEPKVRR